jgi:hypothetical protein
MSRGVQQITQGLGTLDSELFDAIADSRIPLLDNTMPVLQSRGRSRETVACDRSGHGHFG